MKFFNLLKKEIKDLVNLQMIMGIVVVMMLFFMLGNVMGSTMDEVSKMGSTINLCDRDNTALTAEIIDMMKENDTEIKLVDSQGDDYAAILSANDIDNLVIIPEGFSEAFEKGEKPEVINITRMKSASAFASITSDNTAATDQISSCLTDLRYKDADISEDERDIITDPVEVVDNTVVADKSAKISSLVVAGSLSLQGMLLPIIVFVLIMMTSQGLMNAISTEKIDKTLETLLSTPVSRTSILGAKMLAAAIVAMLQAVAYMISFSTFAAGMAGNMGSAINTGTNVAADADTSAIIGKVMSSGAAMNQLGLTLSVTDYLLVGLQLFLTIMICLCVSLILGSLVSDMKSAQTLILPLALCAMIPYIITMMTDVNSLPTALKLVVYAIPFTHTFTSIPNLMFGHDNVFFIGLIYQIIFFAVCLFFALRLFNSDKILTVSLNLGQKSKFKKNQKQYTDE